MKEILEGILNIAMPFIILGLIYLIVNLSFSFWDFRYNRKELLLKKKYPKFYAKIKERDDLVLSQNGKDEYLLKDKIGSLSANLKYFPKEELSLKERELETLKKEYQIAKQENKNKQNKVEKFQKEIMNLYNDSSELQKFYKWK